MIGSALPSGLVLSVSLRTSATMRSTAWLAAINKEILPQLATDTHCRLVVILKLRGAHCRHFFRTSGRGFDQGRANLSRCSSHTVDIDPVNCLSIIPFGCGCGGENHAELCLTASAADSGGASLTAGPQKSAITISPLAAGRSRPEVSFRQRPCREEASNSRG